MRALGGIGKPRRLQDGVGAFAATITDVLRSF